MADKAYACACSAEKLLLEWQHNSQAIGVPGKFLHATTMPRPYLRGDVVQHGNVPFFSVAREPQIEPRIINRYDEVGRTIAQMHANASEQLEKIRQVTYDLEESDHRHLIRMRPQHDTRGLHTVAAEAV